jgi:serine/threonine protein kinase
MPLESGTRLGPYEIVEPIGADGVGEVFRARDTKLGRDVASKVLVEAFTQNPERLTSLNHPNIATNHDVEESDGVRFR